MIEVFKTNVRGRRFANRIIANIRNEFSPYRVNFDLTDVDRILRIECNASMPDIAGIIRIVANAGFEADVLPDIPSTGQNTQVWQNQENRFQIAS